MRSKNFSSNEVTDCAEIWKVFVKLLSTFFQFILEKWNLPECQNYINKKVNKIML